MIIKKQLEEILQKNDLAITKWVHPPKLISTNKLKNFLVFLHDTKRFFIINQLKKIIKTNKKSHKFINVCDFGSGHGGITLDIKKYFGSKVEICGYEVNKKALKIAEKYKNKFGLELSFLLDEEAKIDKYFEKDFFDAVISCDVFGHLLDVEVGFKQINKILKKGGKLVAFSESIVGPNMFIIQFLLKKGFCMDDSHNEHISLHSIKTLRIFLQNAGFKDIEIFPYDPIRFIFYPKRYLKKLMKIKSPLFILCLFFSLFQNRLTEIIYNQLNLFLAKNFAKNDSAGCLIIATKK